MNPLVYYLLALILIATCVVCWLANLLSLPGNWVVAALVAAFAFFLPREGSQGVTPTTVAIVLALAVVGEIIEFAAGAVGAARVGASRRAMGMSMIGAILGSVAGAAAGLPIPVIGSLVAALAGGSLGAFLGAYLGENATGRSYAERVAVGKGAVVGRLWGTVGKIAVGAVMIAVAAVDALFV